MGDKQRELAYDLGFALLGIVMAVSAIFAVLSHLHLDQLEAANDSATFFFEDNQQEQDRWENIRIVAVLGFIGSTILAIAGSEGYYSLKENPMWELKISIASSAILLFGGAGFYFIASDLVPRSIALGLALMGFVLASIGTVFLFYFGPGSDAGSQDSGSGGIAQTADRGSRSPHPTAIAADPASDSLIRLTRVPVRVLVI